MANKKGSSESPINQLAAFRLQLQQQEGAVPKFQPVTNIGEGIAQGVHNILQMHQQAQQNKMFMDYLKQQAAAEARAAEEKVTNDTNTMIFAGVDPMAAIYAGSAGADASTMNALINNRHSDNVSAEQTRQKLVAYSAYMSALKAKGLPDADAAIMANSAILGDRLPIGASELGADIGGTLKTNRLYTATGGHPEALDKTIASPSLRNYLGNYSITPMDAVTEIKRQAEAQNTATNAQYSPYINQANVARTNAATAGQQYENGLLANKVQNAQEWRQVQKKLVDGQISWGQYARAAAAFSDSPLQAVDTVTRNPALYGKSNSFFPNQEAFNFPPPPAPQAPATSVPRPLFQYDNHQSPLQNGAAARQQLGSIGTQIYNYPGVLGNSVFNTFKNMSDFGKGLFGEPNSTPSATMSPLKRFNQAFAPEYPVGF